MDDAAPSYDIDFYAAEVIEDPYPHYREIRDRGDIQAYPLAIPTAAFLGIS